MMFRRDLCTVLVLILYASHLSDAVKVHTSRKTMTEPDQAAADKAAADAAAADKKEDEEIAPWRTRSRKAAADKAAADTSETCKTWFAKVDTHKEGQCAKLKTCGRNVDHCVDGVTNAKCGSEGDNIYANPDHCGQKCCAKYVAPAGNKAGTTCENWMIEYPNKCTEKRYKFKGPTYDENTCDGSKESKPWNNCFDECCMLDPDAATPFEIYYQYMYSLYISWWNSIRCYLPYFMGHWDCIMKGR